MQVFATAAAALVAVVPASTKLVVAGVVVEELAVAEGLVAEMEGRIVLEAFAVVARIAVVIQVVGLQCDIAEAIDDLGGTVEDLVPGLAVVVNQVPGYYNRMPHWGLQMGSSPALRDRSLSEAETVHSWEEVLVAED